MNCICKQVMSEQNKNFKSIRGIAVTGWQRYDHLANLCELFPAGLPSLTLNLLTLSNGKFEPSLYSRFSKILSCSPTRNYYTSVGVSTTEGDLENDQFLWQRASNCFFPGSAVFHMTQHLSEAVKRVNDYVYDVTVHKAWMTDYNVRHNISNPFRIDEALQDHSSVYYTLTSLVRNAEEALKDIFDKFTVSEWIEQNIYPYLLKMEKVTKDAVDLKKARVWPRRPLPPLPDLQRFLNTNGNEWHVKHSSRFLSPSNLYENCCDTKARSLSLYDHYVQTFMGTTFAAATDGHDLPVLPFLITLSSTPMIYLPWLDINQRLSLDRELISVKEVNWKL